MALHRVQSCNMLFTILRLYGASTLLLTILRPSAALSPQAWVPTQISTRRVLMGVSKKKPKRNYEDSEDWYAPPSEAEQLFAQVERASAAASRSAQSQAAKRWGQPANEREREALRGWSRNGGGGGEMLYDDDDGEPAPLKDDDEDDEDFDDGLETAFDEYDFDADLSAVDSSLDSESTKAIDDDDDDDSEDATGGEWLYSPTLTADAYAFDPSSDGGVAALLGKWPGAANGNLIEGETDNNAASKSKKIASGKKGRKSKEDDLLDEFVQELWQAMESGKLSLGDAKLVLKESEMEGDCSPAQADEIMKRVTALAQLQDGNNKEELINGEDSTQKDAAMAKEEVSEEADHSLASGMHLGLKGRGGPTLRREPWDPACNQVWVSAMHGRMFKHLESILDMNGVEVCANYDDWEDGPHVEERMTIGDIAAFKARELFALTGLPSVAERTSVRVDPVGGRAKRGVGDGGGGFSKKDGCYFSLASNNDAADKLIAQIASFKDEERTVTYSSALHYFDGFHEWKEEASCEVAVMLADDLKALIPMGNAIDNLIKHLESELSLEVTDFMSPQSQGLSHASSANSVGHEYFTGSAGKQGSGAMRLRETILKEGRVLPNQILDVSSFMDSKVDVALMEACAIDLANRVVESRPTKILTLATTGLVLALPLARVLQIPVAYARKARSVTMADAHVVSYSSNSLGAKANELVLAKDAILPGDRVLIVDDILSSGAAQEALLRLVGLTTEAKAVGIVALIEKVYAAGRISLSGFNIPVEALVRVLDVDHGQINLDPLPPPPVSPPTEALEKEED